MKSPQIRIFPLGLGTGTIGAAHRLSNRLEIFTLDSPRLVDEVLSQVTVIQIHFRSQKEMAH